MTSASRLIIQQQGVHGQRHVVKCNHGDTVVTYAITYDAKQRLCVEMFSQTSQHKNSLMLIHYALPIIKLQLLAADIAVHLAGWESLSPAARELCQINDSTILFMRPNDLVHLQLPNDQLSFSIQMSTALQSSDQPGPAVEVGSSLPSKSMDQSVTRSESEAVTNQVNHQVGPPFAASIEVTRSLPDAAPSTPQRSILQASTPHASKTRIIVQETPSAQRRFNGFVAVHTSESSGQASQEDIQVKYEEDSLLMDDILDGDEQDSLYPDVVAVQAQIKPESPIAIATDESDAQQVADSFSKSQDSNDSILHPPEVLTVAHDVTPLTESNLDALTSAPIRNESDGTAGVISYADIHHEQTPVANLPSPVTQSPAQHVFPEPNVHPASPDSVVGANENIDQGRHCSVDSQHVAIDKQDSEMRINSQAENLSNNLIAISLPEGQGNAERKRRLAASSDQEQHVNKKIKASGVNVDSDGSSTDDSTAQIPEHPTATIVVNIRSPLHQTPRQQKANEPIAPSPTIAPAKHLSATPSSSAESVASRTRGSARQRGEVPAGSAKTPRSPRVVFSNSKIQEKEMQGPLNFLRARGGRVVEKLSQDFDILVIGTGEIKKTPKFLTAVGLGKPITTDDWVTASAHAAKFLNPLDFVPSDPVHQQAWGFTFNDGKDRHALFSGMRIMITPALKREYGGLYHEIEELVTKLGAKEVVSKAINHSQLDGTTIVVAAEKEDIDASELFKSKLKCYNKELLSTSILRGNLDLEGEEFLVVQPTGSGQAQKRGRPRRSR